MAIQDRFWQLVIIFWSTSAVALVLSLLSKPMLEAVVAEPQVQPPIIAHAAESSSAPRDASPTASRRIGRPVVVARSRGRAIPASKAIGSKEIAFNKTGATSTPAPAIPKAIPKTIPKMVIASADVPERITLPQSNAPATSTSVETIGPLSAIESVASQLGDRISSTQKWLTDEAGITVHGLLDIGTNYNFNQPATGNNLYRVFDYSGASSFEPNQAEFYLSRSMPNQPGFVIDLNFLNAADVLHGLTSYYGDQPGPRSPTGWMDPTQVYMTYTMPIGSGINLTAGRQVSLIGFEYIPSWNNINFNQSIDLLYSLGEPFTVTGLRAAYSFNKYLAATLGLNNGWDTIASSSPFQTFEGQLSITPDEDVTWNIQGMYGLSSGAQSGSKRGLANTTVAWKTPYKPLQLGFEYMFADQSAPVQFSPMVESPAYPNPLLSPEAQPIRHSVWWSGIGLWAAYNPTEALQLATRGEWFGDTSGARSGIAQNLGELTETVSYSFQSFSNLTARIEYGHDISSAHPFPDSGPFVSFVCPAGRCISTAHTYSGQDTFETALILKF
jgi:hypothetical protein